MKSMKMHFQEIGLEILVQNPQQSDRPDEPCSMAINGGFCTLRWITDMIGGLLITRCADASTCGV